METKRQRLVSYAPLAASISAGSLLVYFLAAEQFGGAIIAAAPGLYVPLVITSLAAFALWAAGLVVVVVNLERLDHRATSMRWMQVARGAVLTALVVQVPLDIGLIVRAGVPIQAPAYLLIYVGVGVGLLIHNLVARRVGLFGGVVPWLGIATGVAYILAGIGFGTFPIPGVGMVFYSIGFNVLLLGQALYLVWAIWIGVKLSRDKVVATMAATATH